MQSLVFEVSKFFKANVDVNIAGVLATSSASVVALFIAAWGWWDAKKQRDEDRKEREKKEAKDILRIENNNAAYTSRYLRYLLTIAEQIEYKSNGESDFIRLKSSKLLLDKLSEGWKRVVITQNMSNTISFIDNLKGVDLITCLEKVLVILGAAVNADPLSVEERKFDDCSKIMSDIFSLMFRCARAYQQECYEKLTQSSSINETNKINVVLNDEIIDLIKEINEQIKCLRGEDKAA
ncbi:hypothetical protein [Marinomonas primoryensis]|uniref:hypothetical protein n=1 Tax=Marinomonas primoryensis TaxID=178399 RepID=UPI003703B9E1